MQTATKNVLIIPDFVPTPLNQLLRSVKARIRLKRGDREIVCHYAREQELPQAEGPRRVSVMIEMPGRRVDPDSVLKSLLDCLVCAGLLVNDSSRWCQLGDVRVEKAAKRRTTVVLEDIEES